MNQQPLPIYLLLFCCLLFTAQIQPASNQENDQTIEQQIARLSPLEREAFNIRMRELVKERLDKCLGQAYLEAARYTDSVIIEMAVNQRRLESRIPHKPTRPGSVDFNFNMDSLKIKPLIEEDSSTN
jgi:hypothetical protein